jgi:Glycosyltransferase family 87
MQRIRAVRHGLSLAGLVVLARLYVLGTPGWIPSSDLHAYWAFDPTAPYAGTVGTAGAFLYSPVAAMLALPLHAVPFDVLQVAWFAAGLGCLAWLVGPWALACVAFLPVAGDLYTGNIHLWLAVAIVAGFRYPAAWSFVLLTKVTPGVGLLWFAVRREWRALAIALAVTAGLVLVSLAVVPGWWPEWFGALANSVGGPPSDAPVLMIGPLWLRLPAAAAIVTWGALGSRRWTVPVAALLALPSIWVISPAVLVATVPLWRRALTDGRLPATT